MQRQVIPEILDALPADDPEAVASRRDLVGINFLMGNERWIERQVASFPAAAARGIVEWGSGEGRLARRLARHGPVTGVDLAPRPADLPEAIDWVSGDVFDVERQGGVLVTNLFLHHFEEDALMKLGERMRGFDVVIGVEPWRSGLSLLQGRVLLPFVSRVTRHDMIVSIRAGFAPGELPGRLGLAPPRWEVRERVALRGGLRWMAIALSDACGAGSAPC